MPQTPDTIVPQTFDAVVETMLVDMQSSTTNGFGVTCLSLTSDDDEESKEDDLISIDGDSSSGGLSIDGDDDDNNIAAAAAAAAATTPGFSTPGHMSPAQWRLSPWKTPGTSGTVSSLLNMTTPDTTGRRSIEGNPFSGWSPSSLDFGATTTGTTPLSLLNSAAASVEFASSMDGNSGNTSFDFNALSTTTTPQALRQIQTPQPPPYYWPTPPMLRGIHLMTPPPPQPQAVHDPWAPQQVARARL